MPRPAVRTSLFRVNNLLLPSFPRCITIPSGRRSTTIATNHIRFLRLYSGFRTFLGGRGLTPQQYHFKTAIGLRTSQGKWVLGISIRYATRHHYRYVRWWERSRPLRGRMGLRQSAIHAASNWPTRSFSKAQHRSCTSQRSS